MTVFGMQRCTPALLPLEILCVARRTTQKIAEGKVSADGRVVVREAVNLNDALTRSRIVQGAIASSLHPVGPVPFVAKGFNGGSFGIQCGQVWNDRH